MDCTLSIWNTVGKNLIYGTDVDPEPAGLVTRKRPVNRICCASPSSPMLPGVHRSEATWRGRAYGAVARW